MELRESRETARLNRRCSDPTTLRPSTRRRRNYIEIHRASSTTTPRARTVEKLRRRRRRRRPAISVLWERDAPPSPPVNTTRIAKTRRAGPGGGGVKGARGGNPVRRRRPIFAPRNPPDAARWRGRTRLKSSAYVAVVVCRPARRRRRQVCPGAFRANGPDQTKRYE